MEDYRIRHLDHFLHILAKGSSGEVTVDWNNTIAKKAAGPRWIFLSNCRI